MLRKKIVFFTALLLFTLQLQAQVLGGGNTDINPPGTNTPKSVKTKKGNIKYSYHEGWALLKTGLILKGKFMYVDANEQIPEFAFVDAETHKKKRVPVSMIEQLTLAGSEKGLTTRNDSTEFVWVEKFKDLYRKVCTGTVELLDNSRIIDEKYETIDYYTLIAGRKGYDYKLIKEVANIEPLMTDRPYFMQSLRATGRTESRDYRILMYLINLFNDPDPMRILKWQDATLTLRNGSTLKTRTYLQPMDLRNEYIQSGNTAYLHIHDGKDFKLLTNNDVETIKQDTTTYVKGLYGLTQKYFWGVNWQHNGEKYLIARRIASNNNYFFRNKVKDGLDLVVLKLGNDDTYVKPLNEPDLRKFYLMEIKAREDAANAANTPAETPIGTEVTPIKND